MFELSSPVVLVAACVLMGVCFAALVCAVAHELTVRGLAAELAREREQYAKRNPATLTGLVGLTAPFLPFATAFARVIGLGALRPTLAERYARAGYPGGLSDDELLGLGLLLGVPLAIPLALILALVSPLLAPLGFLLVALGPGLLSAIYNAKGTARELAITRVMPFVLDLLVLTMRAGASLQQAIERVADDYRNHAIGREFVAVQTDLSTGTTVREAFENMQGRIPVPAVRTFVDDLVQGDELGRPLAEIFERQADESRIRRVQEANDTAGKAKVLVLIPGMLVFIAVLILLFAPFGVRWYYEGGLSL